MYAVATALAMTPTSARGVLTVSRINSVMGLTGCRPPSRVRRHAAAMPFRVNCLIHWFEARRRRQRILKHGIGRHLLDLRTNETLNSLLAIDAADRRKLYVGSAAANMTFAVYVGRNGQRGAPKPTPSPTTAIMSRANISGTVAPGRCS